VAAVPVAAMAAVAVVAVAMAAGVSNAAGLAHKAVGVMRNAAGFCVTPPG
jgi:hypothetical protein